MGTSFLTCEARSGAQQSFGVRMARVAQHFGRRAFLNDAARVHHGNAIRDLRDDSEIVRDEQKRETQFAAQFRE